MNKKQFNDALAALSLDNHTRAAAVLGIGRNTVIRYAHGHTDVPEIVSRYIAMLIEHGIPQEHAQ